MIGNDTIDCLENLLSNVIKLEMSGRKGDQIMELLEMKFLENLFRKKSYLHLQLIENNTDFSEMQNKYARYVEESFSSVRHDTQQQVNMLKSFYKHCCLKGDKSCLVLEEKNVQKQEYKFETDRTPKQIRDNFHPTNEKNSNIAEKSKTIFQKDVLVDVHPTQAEMLRRWMHSGELNLKC